ncbi:MAG TPA: rhodanese-like domain-containing protein [Deltaproteobacteria bacterium]|nr:rhodanese-like domain-containing protein [Deltaproteobacteria bacterium]
MRILYLKLILVIFMVPVLSCCTDTSSKDYQTSGAYIIDVRTEAEYKAGHLKGAVLIPYDQIEKKIPATVQDFGARIYVYCRSGRRSGIAKDVLNKLGYRDVINLGSVSNAAKSLDRQVVKD